MSDEPQHRGDRTKRPRLLADNFRKCDQCGEIVLIHGRGECLELDDAVYCPRHASGRIDDADWESRWGTAMDLLETIRNDPTKAIKYHMAQGIGDRWIVHREDQIYEKWGRCEADERNCTTTSESSVVRDIERRALVGSYVGYAPHIVDIDDAPINATVESKQKAVADGGVDMDQVGHPEGDSGRYSSWKSDIRSELDAMEGEGPPTADQLWNVAAYQSRSASDWIEDMPLTEDAIETARGDVLEALVALEMAEERMEGDDAE